MSQQNPTQIKCSDCGKSTTVSFKPTAGKPVYCRECLIKHRTKRTEEAKDHSADNDKQAWARRREGWKQ